MSGSGDYEIAFTSSGSRSLNRLPEKFASALWVRGKRSVDELDDGGGDLLAAEALTQQGAQALLEVREPRGIADFEGQGGGAATAGLDLADEGLGLRDLRAEGDDDVVAEGGQGGGGAAAEAAGAAGDEGDARRSAHGVHGPLPHGGHKGLRQPGIGGPWLGRDRRAMMDGWTVSSLPTSCAAAAACCSQRTSG